MSPRQMAAHAELDQERWITHGDDETHGRSRLAECEAVDKSYAGLLYLATNVPTCLKLKLFYLHFCLLEGLCFELYGLTLHIG